MELREAINGRRSIRGFVQTPIPQEILRDVLEMGVRAVSATNVQPWGFFVVTGPTLDMLREENIRCLLERVPFDMPDQPLSGVFDSRRRTVGKQLFAAMDIAREDKKARAEWTMRGFRFFDAPAVIFICMDHLLDEKAFRLEIGSVTQNICLAAMEHVLGTCVENQAVMFQKPLRRRLGIPAEKNIEVGIAIGYPDQTFPANGVVTERESLERNVVWHGFI